MNQMNRRHFVKTLGLGAGVLAAPSLLAASRAKAATAPAASGAARPNIIYLILDEWGYYEWSGMGHPILQTPNIDRFAADGMRFTQLLAGGHVCAPARCALMTGQHTGHCPIRDNFPRIPLHPDDVTIAEVLKQAGYATGGFGKWGLGDRGTSGVPEKHGFDVFFGYYDQVHAHSYYPRYLIRNSEKVNLPGNTDDWKEGETYSHYLIYRESIRFIKENGEAKKPFFAYLCWTPPHGKHVIPATDPAWLRYKDLELPGKSDAKDKNAALAYGAMIEMVDRQLGDILAMLKKTGIEDNTIIFLSGDNGGAFYFADAKNPDGVYRPNVNPKTEQRFRGSKDIGLYEGGIRVPFLVRWSGHIKGGTVSDHLGYFPDVLPTVAEFAGVAPPAGIDGISIVPTLLGRGGQKQHEYLYWENADSVAVRIGHWKAIRPPKQSDYELYDLSKDIEELNNLADQHPDIIAKAKACAQEAHRSARPGIVFDPDATWEGERKKAKEAK